MTKKENIFKAALHLFVKNGIDKTPTAKIAAEAGVAIGTLFHHFKNKEELVNALYLEVKSSIADSMSSGINEIKDEKEIFRHIWDSFMTWSFNNPELFQFNTLFCESPVITKNTKRQLAGETFHFLSEINKEGKTSKFSRDLPFDFLEALSISVLVRSARYFIENPEAFNDSLIVNEAFEACWGMLNKS